MPAAKLSIEKLATCRAALEAGQKKESVVAELGETAASWADQEEQIMAEHADEVDRGAIQRVEATRLPRLFDRPTDDRGLKKKLAPRRFWSTADDARRFYVEA